MVQENQVYLNVQIIFSPKDITRVFNRHSNLLITANYLYHNVSSLRIPNAHTIDLFWLHSLPKQKKKIHIYIYISLIYIYMYLCVYIYPLLIKQATYSCRTGLKTWTVIGMRNKGFSLKVPRFCSLLRQEG